MDTMTKIWAGLIAIALLSIVITEVIRDLR